MLVVREAYIRGAYIWGFLHSGGRIFGILSLSYSYLHRLTYVMHLVVCEYHLECDNTREVLLYNVGNNNPQLNLTLCFFGK